MMMSLKEKKLTFHNFERMLEVEKKKTSGRKRPRPGDVDVAPAPDAHGEF